MSNKKILIAILLILILLAAVITGVRYSDAQEQPTKPLETHQKLQPAQATNQPQPTQQPAVIAATVSKAQPQSTVTVRETPYGKVVTTQQEGVKNGVHYRVIDAEVLPPTYDLSHKPQPQQPRIVVTKTPYGKTVTAEYEHGPAGTHYQIIESMDATQLTPEQSDQLRRRIISQQHYMEQAIHRDMQQMMQQMPPLRFQAPNHYYNPNH